MDPPPVVSNTGPLIGLASIGAVPLLARVYGVVHIPQAVRDEIDAGNATGIFVPSFEWMRVEANEPQSERELLYELDDGEAQAILLARRMRALLLVDERLGRRVAQRLGVRITGTVGVLTRCRRDGLIPSFRDAADRLLQNNIRLSRSLIDEVASQLGE